MTLTELREYTSLKSDEIYYEVEIQRLKILQAEKVSYYKSPALDAVPGTGGASGSTTESLALLNIEYGEKIKRQIEDCSAALETVRQRLQDIESFILSIEDREARSMLRRHIQQRVSFNQIAKEHFVSRNYVARKIKGVCK